MNKFFTKIGKGIREAFGGVGKFMDEVGIFGQVAMMFIPIPGIGSVAGMASDALGGVGSMITDKLANIPGGQKIANGANWVLEKAREFSTKGQNAYKNITGAVKDFFEVAGGYVKGKLGVGEEMTFGEAVSKYTDKVSERYHRLRDESRVGAIAETPKERAEREAAESTETTDPVIEAGYDVEVRASDKVEAPEITLEDITAEPMPEQNVAIREALEKLDSGVVEEPRQTSLLSDIDIPTTGDMRTETDEAIEQAIEFAPKEEEEHMLGRQVLDYFNDQSSKMVKSQLQSLILGDDEGARPRARRSPQRMPRFVTRSPYPDLPASRTPDIFPAGRTNVPMSPNGMWGAASTYQNDIAERLRYGTVLQ